MPLFFNEYDTISGETSILLSEVVKVHKNWSIRLLRLLFVTMLCACALMLSASATDADILSTYATWGSSINGRLFFAFSDGNFRSDSTLKVTTATSTIAAEARAKAREAVGTALLQAGQGGETLNVYPGLEVYEFHQSNQPQDSSTYVGRFWGSGAESFNPCGDKEEGSYVVRIEGAAGDYYIFLPPAGYYNIEYPPADSPNKEPTRTWVPYSEGSPDAFGRAKATIRAAAKTAINQIKEEIKLGIIAAYIDAGFNVFSAYSPSQMPLSTVMVADGELFKFKENLSSSQLSYSLDYFMHPALGKISGIAVPKEEKDWRLVATGTYTATYKPVGSTTTEILSINFGDFLAEDKISLKVCDGYTDFIAGKGDGRETLDEMGNTRQLDQGVKKFSGTSTVDGPKNYIDYGMTVMLPDIFVATKATGFFGLKSDSVKNLSLHKFTVDGADEVRLSLRNDTFYKYSNNGTVQKFLTCADIQLQREHIVLYNYNSGGALGSTTNPPVYTGIVIPLQYWEGVANTKKDSNANPPEDDVYFTGRTVVLDNSYSGKLPFFDTNRDILFLDTTTSGKEGISGSYFAFSSKEATWDSAFYLDSANHVAYNSTPNSFRFIIDFKSASATNSEDNAQGFVIIRNNAYVKDESLLQWLDSDKAKSIPFVKAAVLKAKILGEFSAGQRELTFADWQNMQRIKQELDAENEGALVSVIRVICIIFGVFLVVFAVLIIMAYWFDVFNTFLDFSLIQLISMGRMYPVSSKEESKYMMPTSMSVKYVTFKDILKIAVISVFVGVGFMYFTPILTFLYNIFAFLSYRFGG